VDDSVFLQGHEADEFLDNVRETYYRLEDVDCETVILALAKPYIDALI